MFKEAYFLVLLTFDLLWEVWSQWQHQYQNLVGGGAKGEVKKMRAKACKINSIFAIFMSKLV